MSCISEILDGQTLYYRPPKNQPDKVVDNAPVSTTVYPVLPMTKDVRILSIAIKDVFTVQPDPLEVILNINGFERVALVNNPTTNTYYYIYNPEAGSTFALASTSYAHSRAFFIEEQQIKVDCRTTGGTVSQMVCRLKWAKWG